VGVFVNASPETVGYIIDECQLDVAQLHGDYPITAFRQFSAQQVVAVARVSDTFQASDLNVFQEHAAAILLDTHKKGLYGGTGETFDWQAAIEAKTSGGQLGERIILAGGLNPDNIQQAVDTVQPYAVDVGSGVEAEPGKKDPDKLRLLFQHLKPYRQHWQPGEHPCFPLS
jgi:phosphoribosylanthranilate isomerase